MTAAYHQVEGLIDAQDSRRAVEDAVRAADLWQSAYVKGYRAGQAALRMALEHVPSEPEEEAQ